MLSDDITGGMGWNWDKTANAWYCLHFWEHYAFSGDKKYLERDAKEMAAYLDKLQQPNGLFYHAPDVPFFWGRGDGWVAAGMAEMLRDLHERRNHDCSNHLGEVAPHFDYLTGWINDVTRELESRGHRVDL